MASYEKRENGKWTVRFRFENNEQITQKRLSGFNTKKEAEEAYHEFLNKTQAENLKPDDKAISFTVIYEAYFNYLEKRVKPSSFYEIRKKLDKQILPHFKNFQINKITPLDILNWQKTVENFSFKYKSNLLASLKNILNFADKYYDIPSISKKIENFRNLEPKREFKIWEPEDFHKFIQCVDNPTYHALFYLLYTCGLRKSEALALQWPDLDLSSKKLKINKTLTRKISGLAWAIQTPKTKNSNREILIPEKVFNEIINLPKNNDDDFIFGGEIPIAENTLSRKFKNWTLKAEVPEIRIHDLRHSCASFMICHCNASISAVANRLGHTVEMCLNTYAHMLPNEELLILEHLNKL